MEQNIVPKMRKGDTVRVKVGDGSRLAVVVEDNIDKVLVEMWGLLLNFKRRDVRPQAEIN